MSLFISKLISSTIQIILFSLIPFIWWLVKARKKENFFHWIGLKGIEDLKKNKTYLWIAGIAAAFVGLAVFMLYSLKGVETATSDFAGLGAAALPAIFVYAVFNTALSEEILFRGFLLKRISNKFGLTAGNIIQGVLFGLLHGVMFFSTVGAVKAVIIICFTGVIGISMGYVNEKKAGGSIIPGWCIHAIANIFSGACAAFSLF
ncbi:MAG: CPBP family intramembrane metalloprotease [Lachnospiraceae bacterium]|nr:CPBP family intramembrane metalloprotease [Lachnospiraceae bacterium]